MIVTCQNPLCGKEFESRYGEAQCCQPKCYKQKKELTSIDQRLKEAFASDKTHTELLSQ